MENLEMLFEPLPSEALVLLSRKTVLDPNR
jgi:hypothetical protein